MCVQWQTAQPYYLYIRLSENYPQTSARERAGPIWHADMSLWALNAYSWGWWEGVIKHSIVNSARLIVLDSWKEDSPLGSINVFTKFYGNPSYRIVQSGQRLWTVWHQHLWSQAVSEAVCETTRDMGRKIRNERSWKLKLEWKQVGLFCLCE